MEKVITFDTNKKGIIIVYQSHKIKPTNKLGYDKIKVGWIYEHSIEKEFAFKTAPYVNLDSETLLLISNKLSVMTSELREYLDKETRQPRNLLQVFRSIWGL